MKKKKFRNFPSRSWNERYVDWEHEKKVRAVIALGGNGHFQFVYLNSYGGAAFAGESLLKNYSSVAMVSRLIGHGDIDNLSDLLPEDPEAKNRCFGITTFLPDGMFPEKRARTAFFK